MNARAMADRAHAITMCTYYYDHEFYPTTFRFGLIPMPHFIPASVPSEEVVSELLRRYPQHAPYRSEIDESFNKTYGETVKVNPNKWRDRQGV